MPLTESFVVALARPPSLTSATAQQAHSKDATIYKHEYQPTSRVNSAWRNSKATSNCLAISATHIFAAQSGKSTVHVYSRIAPGQNAETLVHFEERIRSIALACNETVLVLGLEGGSLALWDTVSGRQINTGASHLHAVDVLAVDLADNFVLSGSADSLVLVWPLLQLLSFARSTRGFDHLSSGARKPQSTLSKHSGSITALALGHGYTTANIAVSAATDRTAVIWDYHSGTALATYLLTHTALCLELDPADRGFFAGLEEGSIQRVDFYSTQGRPQTFNSLRNNERERDIPRQPPQDSTWMRSAIDTSMNSVEVPSSDGAAHNVNKTTKDTRAEQSTPRNPEATLCLSLSYDTATLLTGHQNGRVTAWNTATGSIIRDVVTYADAPVTNLHFLEPTGWLNQVEPTRSIYPDKVTKPQPHQPWSGKDGGVLESGYAIYVKFPNDLSYAQKSDLLGLNADSKSDDVSFDALLNSVHLPESLFLEAIREFTDPEPMTGPASATAPIAPAPDFVPLDTGDSALTETATEVDALRDKIERLEKSQRVSIARVRRLAAENAALKEKEERRIERKRQRMVESRNRTDGMDAGSLDERQACADSNGELSREDDSESDQAPGSEMMDE